MLSASEICQSGPNSIYDFDSISPLAIFPPDSKRSFYLAPATTSSTFFHLSSFCLTTILIFIIILSLSLFLGTSACNGDSGGGYHIFVPDTSGDSSANATGTWHVRGIVSTSVARQDAAICDPTHFVLFTDVAKYKGWVAKYMT